MSKPRETLAEIVRPERQLWDGAYAVALANTTRGTRNDRPPIETIQDFLAWCHHVGLPLAGVNEPEDVLRRALDLREIAAGVVHAGLERRDADPADVDALQPHASRALGRLCLRYEPPGCQLDVNPSLGADRVLDLVALSLVNLLSSGDFHKIRVCEGACDLVFVHRGRGKGRRWCDMDTCGAQEKVRRRKQQRHQDAERYEANLQREHEAFRRRQAARKAAESKE